MLFPTACPHCTRDFQAEFADSHVHDLTCPHCGGKSCVFVRKQKFEMLFDLGTRALMDGYAREAVASFSAALERFFEFYVKAAALERAQALASVNLTTRAQRDEIADAIGGFRFTTGFGKTLSRLLRAGIGVHHAGMLPRYRRLVETLAQRGLLKVICGTDTLGVGINVPIRTVMITALSKYDGARMRQLSAREFHQVAGRAGRAGYDTYGNVVVMAPEWEIENAVALAKAGDDAAKRKKIVRKKAPTGVVNWGEGSYERLIAAAPEPLVPQLKLSAAMLINVIGRGGDVFANVRALVFDNHEPRARKYELARRAIAIFRTLVDAGIVEVEREPASAPRIRLTVDLQPNFALNQPLSPFALAAIDLLDPEVPPRSSADGGVGTGHYALDVVSVIEATLDDPRVILSQQEYKARGEAVAAMKRDGIEYDERMELLEDISWPQPLAELLDATFETYRSGQPWVAESALSPKTVVREMYENAWSFGELVRQYELSRSEGIVLRYLTDVYRTVRQLLPQAARNEEIDDFEEWLGETIRQTDSSLLDEWEALVDPSGHPNAEVVPVPPRAVTRNERAFRVQIRNAMFRRLKLAAARRAGALAALDKEAAASTEPPTQIVMDEAAWDDDIAHYFDDHDEMLLTPDARGPQLLRIEKETELWRVRQVVLDPAGDLDWGIDAEVPLAASDEAGEPVIVVLGLNRLDG